MLAREGAPGYFCPADIEPELEKKLKYFALRAHFLLNALDVSRTDIRLDAQGNPRVMEINTLPGLTPSTAICACKAKRRAYAMKT